MGNFAVLLIDVCGAASTSEKLVDYVSTMIGLRAGFLAFKAFHEDSSWVCAMVLNFLSTRDLELLTRPDIGFCDTYSSSVICKLIPPERRKLFMDIVF